MLYLRLFNACANERTLHTYPVAKDVTKGNPNTNGSAARARSNLEFRASYNSKDGHVNATNQYKEHWDIYIFFPTQSCAPREVQR